MENVAGIPSITELWSKSINASELFNVERKSTAGPDSGGGQLYFQIPVRRVEDTLKFLRTTYERLPVTVQVRNIGSETEQALTFHNKSAGRMRTGPQNRQRGQRLEAWSPEYGFPRLSNNVTSRDEAEHLLEEIGGLHIFLARTVSREIWAGYTIGTSPPMGWPDFVFNHLLFGLNEPGGFWRAP